MVATPLLLTIMLPYYEEMGLTKPACNCLYMLLLMAVYWCTETVPLAVTSLIPLVLAPLLSINKADTVARSYLKDLNVMFMGGLMVAVVIEHTNLHRRIALSVLKVVGTNPRFLMLGFMLPTWFLSMWISNTATTAMMIAIVQAVISQLNSEDLNQSTNVKTTDANGDAVIEIEMTKGHTAKDNGKVNGAFDVTADGIDSTMYNGADPESAVSNDVSDVNLDEVDETEKESKPVKGKWEQTSIALSLCVCYAATCGGIATLTGTTPNIVLGENVNTVSKTLNDYDFGFDFVSWMGFGLPVSFLMLILAWIWLQIFFLGFRGNTQTEEEKKLISSVINRAYNELGSIKFGEVLALIHFILLALLWISRNPGGAGGWGSLFPKGYVSDATAAMFIVILTFLWPAEMPDLFCFRGGCGVKKAKHRAPLVTWDSIVKKVPWGLILLLGGGFALADAITVSGLSKAIGESLNFFDGWPTWGIIMCLATITASITEITSNTAISTIFLPIVANVALALKISPLLLMLPVTAASSFAFMLPVATPPNALVFATGVLSIKEMAKAGFALNILGILVVTLATVTWGTALFKLNEFDYFTGNGTVNFTITAPEGGGGH